MSTLFWNWTVEKIKWSPFFSPLVAPILFRRLMMTVMILCTCMPSSHFTSGRAPPCVPKANAATESHLNWKMQWKTPAPFLQKQQTPQSLAQDWGRLSAAVFQKAAGQPQRLRPDAQWEGAGDDEPRQSQRGHTAHHPGRGVHRRWHGLADSR